MTIGRARTNHRAEIEDQYSILSQMIEEISFQFKERLEKIKVYEAVAGLSGIT